MSLRRETLVTDDEEVKKIRTGGGSIENVQLAGKQAIRENNINLTTERQTSAV